MSTFTMSWILNYHSSVIIGSEPAQSLVISVLLTLASAGASGKLNDNGCDAGADPKLILGGVSASGFFIIGLILAPSSNFGAELWRFSGQPGT